jgi:molybdopterin molybdotransferase
LRGLLSRGSVEPRQNEPVVTFDEALEIIRENVRPISESETVQLSHAAGRILAEPIVASRANPAFDNSGVDGYLLAAASAEAGATFELVGEIRAGSLPPFVVPAFGQAVRIFTGAPSPPGPFCIAMQEDVRLENGRIRVTEALGEGANIRRRGRDFQEGTELATAGCKIGSAELAMLAWNGCSAVETVRQPRVGICVTGDELVPVGQPLQEGQIHDSNAPMLESLARTSGASEVVRVQIGDDFEETCAALEDLSRRSDLVVVSGGASVGDYDHIPRALEKLGRIYFYKASIKPGKPILFGEIGNSIVFGLPGNPGSAFVCFALFVRPALEKLGGSKAGPFRRLYARFDGEHAPANRDEFERVRLELRELDLWAVPVFEQGSFGLRSLAAADGLARLLLGKTYRRGDPVEITLLR